MKKTINATHGVEHFGAIVFTAQSLARGDAKPSLASQHYLGSFVSEPLQKYQVQCEKNDGSSKFTCAVYMPADGQKILYQLQCCLKQQQFEGCCNVLDADGNIKMRLAVYGQITKKAILIWGIADSVLVLSPVNNQGDA